MCTWSLRVHCSVQISVIRFLACLAISSRNMLHNDRLRSPMWWRWRQRKFKLKVKEKERTTGQQNGAFYKRCFQMRGRPSVYLPPRDRARVYRTWSACRAEGSRWSVGSGREAPNTAGTSFRMRGCRSCQERERLRWRCFKSSSVQFCMGLLWLHARACPSYQKIDRSDVSTSISTRESTIFVWKMMVFIILPSSLWSAIPRLALETLV